MSGFLNLVKVILAKSFCLKQNWEKEIGKVIFSDLQIKYKNVLLLTVMYGGQLL